MNQTSPSELYELGYNYQKGISVNKDEKKAFELYLKAANMGYSTAMIDVGYCYEKGIGVEKDEHKAFIYYQKSANIGHALGTNNVGYCYEKGIGVGKDENKAFIYYQTSADMGDALGTNNVGYCYDNGIGVKKDEYKAFFYYQKSADMGDALGANNVGGCYQNGIGVQKDEHKAFFYYQKLAEIGDANGTHGVGYCYEKGIGVEKDERKAFSYYQKSADMGHALGTNNVGYCYEKGIGVGKDENKAFIYYQKSADMGDALGTNNVGYCYDNGIGVEKDKHKAFIYYKKSANLGDAKGTFNVGICYQRGIGVKKDEHKAFFYYQKSADMDHTGGMFNCGCHYERGVGVEKDDHKAFNCYHKSAAMGNVNGMTAVAQCFRNGVGVERDIQNANYWYRRANKLVTVVYECASKTIDFDYDLRKMLLENNYQLPWIPYEEFKNIIEIGKGGFATVYCASWDDKSRNVRTNVALKMLNLNGHLEFIKELKVFCEIRDVYPSFLKCYGITKNVSGEYTLVLEYANKQSLSKNLYDVARMTWKNKVKLLQCIISDINMIHFQGYVHRDLHSGNILQQDIDNAYVVDLGFSSSIKSDIEGIYGVLPYVAPEVLSRQSSFTQASDIYSFGIIMTEISVGQRPFDGVPFDKVLAAGICFGLRPEFALGTPNCYVELANQCMDPNPQKRPTTSVITDKLNKWFDSICAPPTVQDIETRALKNQFIEADRLIKELPTVGQKHLNHMYTSKLINTREITEKLLRIDAGSKLLYSINIPYYCGSQMQ